MLIYHASPQIVKSPDINHSREKLDFGKGFYATILMSQAISYGQRFTLRGESAYLNVYNLNLPNKYIIKSFDRYDEEWLDFVLSCRRGKSDYLQYDIIMGGIANDKVFNTLDLYFSQMITKEEALKRLIFEKPNQQICFTKQNVIDESITFIKYSEIR